MIDFIIGATLMNAMPHLVLGIWKARMFSAFGFGDFKNIAYGLVCFLISISFFIFKYGVGTILSNGIYLGALGILVIYMLTGRFWYNLFNKK
jgi:hypothetical protein